MLAQPIQVDQVARGATSVAQVNAQLVALYGKHLTSQPNIPDDLNAINDSLVKLISQPGNEAYAERFTSNREQFGDDATSLLNMAPDKRLEVIRYMNYSSLFRDEYIVIDSRYQNTVNTNTSIIEFALVTSTKVRAGHGGIIVGNRLQDIVELEVYPFTIPYKPTYVTFYNRITLTINDWTTNAFEAYEGGQYHFLFDIEHVDNNLIYLRPINSTYSFSTPVNQIDSFSLSFGAVYPKISFDADRMTPSEISTTDPYGLLTFASPHNLVTGDLIYITGFDTPEPALDVVLIDEVNRSQGHIVVKKDNYSIVINVDISAARHESPVGSGRYPLDSFAQTAQVFFASKRIQIQMRLRYLTNYS
jgi:hypothetical protein